MKYDDAAILVFAKAPIPGTVNTRLIPAIGVAAATRLQDELLQQRLASLASAKLCEVILMCAPDVAHHRFTECKKCFDVSLSLQQGDDLGERIVNGLKQVFADRGHKETSKNRVIVIGTDAPALTADTIEKAIQKLSSSDVVAVPAEDGGYVLLGMSSYRPELFQGIDWGSEIVMQQTREAGQRLQLQLVELESCWDVDREEDYRRYLMMKEKQVVN